MKPYLYLILLMVLISASCSNSTQKPIVPPNTLIPLESGVSHDLNGVFFEDAQNGYAVGDSGIIIKTTNGGESWSIAQTSFTNNLYSCFSFGGKKYVGGAGIVAFGENVETLNNSTNLGTTAIHSFSALNDGKVIAVGGYYAINSSFGVVLTKNSNSTTWSFLADSLISFGTITDVITIGSSSVLWCVQNCNFCPKGINRFNFNTMVEDTSLSLSEYGMSSINKYGATILSVSNSRIARSLDTGMSWIQQTSPNNAILNDVAMVNSSTGYACGDNGVLLLTTNSGETWSTVESGTTKNLYSIFFPTSTIGYAVGASGTVIKIIIGEN